MIEYSEKQRELMELWQEDKLRRINVLEGSVRSGKTWITLVLWALWIATMPEDAAYLMVAKTLTSLRRNCLDLLETLVGRKNFTYSIPKKEARLFGRLVYLEGVNDARAESKIRGMTLQGALCDELTLFTEDFFAMLLSRLSLPGAKLFGSTNPDNPGHWLMEKYIKRQDELDMLVMKFLIDDNPALDPEYVKQLKREYTGVFYRRFILGEWCVAEGLVYPMYANTVEPEERAYTKYAVSMDYGIQNATAMLLWGLCGGIWYAIREYYHSGRETGRQMTDQEYYDELERLAGDLPIWRLIIDPSASSFIALCNQKKRFKVWKAKNDVVDGIRHTATALQERKVLFDPCCKRTIQEFGLYSWDDKSGIKTGEDKPIKENDHAMDAVRYFVNTTGLWREKQPQATIYPMMKGR